MPNETSFLNTQTSDRSVAEVINRIETKLKDNNIKIFARINHAEEARKVGLTMQDEEVIIFGNPNVGTHLMLENPYIGIELPLKVLAWRAEKAKKTIIVCDNLEFLANSFELKTSLEVIKKLKLFMADLINIT